MTAAQTPPAAWDRHALEVAKGIASIDRSKLPGLTTQFVAILQEAIVQSMMMAGEQSTPRALGYEEIHSFAEAACQRRTDQFAASVSDVHEAIAAALAHAGGRVAARGGESRPLSPKTQAQQCPNVAGNGQGEVA